jgi:hypothetical protein
MSLKNWKKAPPSEPERVNYTRKGKLGRNCPIENAHKIELGYSYNGGGEDAFGGARKWPTLRIEISFEEGHELSRNALAAALIAEIDRHLEQEE